MPFALSRRWPAWFDRSMLTTLVFGVWASIVLESIVRADDAPRGDAERGYRVLRSSRFLPPDFDEDVFSRLWEQWPEPERSAAEAASPNERRTLTFRYYGLMRDPADVDGSGVALGYVPGPKNSWVMSCLACHGGKVGEQVIPGLGNSHFAMQTLTDDVRATKLAMKKPLSHLDLGSLKMPLSLSNGTTNAVVFGVVLGAFRKPDMTVDLSRRPPPIENHDVDAPPFWNVRKKTSLYCDGFSPKTHRPLMQFMLLPTNSAQTVYGWEDDFRDILAWIESVEPPKWPHAIDRSLAARGEAAFVAHCSRCHGTYGPAGRYEQKTIPIAELGVDAVRFEALSAEHRRWMHDGWMSRYGQDAVIVDPAGYVAPPLDGIWASGPYFHNGSTPTLWHVLHPARRPVVWKRTDDGYDPTRVGLEIEEFDQIPDDVDHPAHLRRYFNTRLKGKSAAGHTFPDALTEPEKAAVLEYLKTL